MPTDVEDEINRANTTAWIESDTVSLVLSREAKVADGAGGFVTNEVDLPAQSFRIDRSSNASVQFVTTPTGTSVPERFRLVGAPDADVQEGDEFSLNGGKFEVTRVHRQTYQRTAAEVEYYGR